MKAGYTVHKVNGTTEAKVITAMHRVCFPRCAVYDIEPAHWWLAYDPEDTPGAFAGLHVGVKEAGAYLCRAGVLPKHRGHGLQLRLIKVRERLARSMGLGFLITDTICNPVSANHLIDCGFRLFDPITPWGCEGSLYWRKTL